MKPPAGSTGKYTDACLQASPKYELIVLQACVDSLHCHNQWVSTYVTTSLTLILHVFTLDIDIPTDCKWKLKLCKAMMISNRRQNHNFSQSYFFITLLLYRYFLIVQGPKFKLKWGISLIRWSLSFYNWIDIKTWWFNHWQIIWQWLTDIGVMDIKFRMILENDEPTLEQALLENDVRKGWINNEWKESAYGRCH